MKSIGFNRIIWVFLGILVLALIIIVALGTLSGVAVKQVYPADNGLVGPWVKIGINFGQTMVKDQTEKALQISPPVSGDFSWDGKTLWLTPTKPLQAGAIYTATLSTGARGEDGRKLSKTLVWKFSVRSPAIVYISPAEKGSEIWRNDNGPGAARQLTFTHDAVADFAVARDGETIAYSVANSQGGIDLWAMDREGNNQKQLVGCGLDQCSMPAWSPSGDRIAYSRQTRENGPNSVLNPPRVWTVNILTTQSTPLMQDPSIEGEFPGWSPDGNYLAFYDEGHASLHALNLQTSQDSLVPSQHDDRVAWSPDGSAFLFANVLSTGEQSYLAVYQVDLASHKIAEPFKDLMSGVDASLPGWSPDGKWVIMGLRSLQGGDSNQLWLIGFNHEPPIQVTSEQNYTQAGYQWNTQGNRIVYQRYHLGRSDSHPEILVWNKDTGQSHSIAQDASLPEWLP